MSGPPATRPAGPAPGAHAAVMSHRSGGAPGEDGRDWLDQMIELASGATAVGMFAYGYALSYQVLHAIAAAAGLPTWASGVWPLGFEAFMAAAALNALAEQRRRRHLPAWWQRVPWYPWTLTGLTAGGSLLLNWFHPAIPLDPPPGWLVSVVYGLPPLAAVLAWHLFLQRIAHRRHPAAAAAAGEAGPSRRDEQAPVPAPPVDGEAETTGTVPAPGSAPGPATPAVPAVPASDPAEADAGPSVVPAPAAGDGAGQAPSRPGGTRTGTDPVVSAELVARATAVAQAFQAEHARPISRDTLGRALHVGNRAAGELLRAVRAAPPPAAAAAPDQRPVPVPRDGEADPTGTVPAPPARPSPPGPAQPDANPSPAPGRVPGPGSSQPTRNGTGPRPGDHPRAPASPSSSSSSSRTPARIG
jgi:hypothetical protein